MKRSSLLMAILAAVILLSGSIYAGEGCGKAKAEKKESTCKKENADKKCEKAKDPNCPKAAETKPAA